MGVSHPLDRLRREAMGEGPLLRIQLQLDCVEVFNARCLLSIYNQQTAAWASRHRLPGTAGSDAHHVSEIGRAFVEMPSIGHRDDFLEALAQGQIRGRLSSPWVHVLSTLAKIRGQEPGHARK